VVSNLKSKTACLVKILNAKNVDKSSEQHFREIQENKLGSVDISSQPNKSTGKMKKRHISFGQFVESGEDTSEVFNFVYKTLDKMPLFINMPVIVLRFFPVGTRRDDRDNSAFSQMLPERVTVKPFIGGNCVWLEAGYQRLCLSHIVTLPRSQNESEGIPEGIHDDMNFGAEAAPTPAQSLFLLTAVLLQCPGCTGMGPDYCAVRDQKLHIRIPCAEGEEPFPYSFGAPSGKPSVNGVPQSELSRKKPPLGAAAHDPKHGFNKPADFGLISSVNTGLFLQKSQYFLPLIFS